MMLDTSRPTPLSATRSNPLLAPERVKTVDVDDIAVPTVLVRTKRDNLRELKELRRKQTAAVALEGLTQANELYGFTKGQFSLLDLMRAVLDITGPARVTLSTWTAARHEIQTLDRLLKSGQLIAMRWLVDFTFSRRDPEAAHQIRQSFGLDSVRVAQNHSKFALFENATWRLVIRTSMNLNMNPRFEDFTVAHDPELADFLARILDDIWNRQERSLADASLKTIARHFREQL